MIINKVIDAEKSQEAQEDVTKRDRSPMCRLTAFSWCPSASCTCGEYEDLSFSSTGNCSRLICVANDVGQIFIVRLSLPRGDLLSNSDSTASVSLCFDLVRNMESEILRDSAVLEDYFPQSGAVICMEWSPWLKRTNGNHYAAIAVTTPKQITLISITSQMRASNHRSSGSCLEDLPPNGTFPVQVAFSVPEHDLRACRWVPHIVDETSMDLLIVSSTYIMSIRVNIVDSKVQYCRKLGAVDPWLTISGMY